MQPSGRSFWFSLQLLCIVCCIMTLTSYRVNYRLTDDDRHARAVTEWRFRRNHLLSYPHFYQSHVKNNHWVNNDENNMHNQPDEIKVYQKKFIIPQLTHP